MYAATFKCNLQLHVERAFQYIKRLKYLYWVILAVHTVYTLGILVTGLALREDVSFDASHDVVFLVNTSFAALTPGVM